MHGPLIVCPSRADEHKDVSTFILAVSEIVNSDQLPNTIFVLCSAPGDEASHENILLESGRLKLGNRLVMRHFAREEMATIYKCSRVCVIPSRRESFGYTVLEAFLFGVPVVASNSTALREIIVNRQNGLLFTGGSSSDLTSQILSLMEDDNLRTRCIRAGKALVSKGSKYHLDTMVDKYWRLYADVKARHDAQQESMKKGRERRP